MRARLPDVERQAGAANSREEILRALLQCAALVPAARPPPKSFSLSGHHTPTHTHVHSLQRLALIKNLLQSYVNWSMACRDGPYGGCSLDIVGSCEVW